MKLAKNFAAATLLVFTLSLTSFAGDQQTPGYVPPPPPPTSSLKASSETDDNATKLPGMTEVTEEMTSDSLWYEALVGLLSIY